jgi:tetratricopeptide (TPR) repeat protein
MRWLLAVPCTLCLLHAPRAMLGARNPYEERLARRETELRARRSTPGGVIPLLGLLSFWERAAPEAVERILEVARGRRSHPLVQGYGAYLASLVAGRRGRLEEAVKLRAQSGHIGDWLLCGPFDNQGRRGHGEVFPVERDLARWPELDRDYPAKEQKARWRPITAFLQEPRIPLGSLTDPNREAVAYLQTFVSSSKVQPAVLRLGTAGAYKVFLGGREVAAREVYRASRPDQDAVAFWLGRGVQRLAIKSAVDDGRWELHARLTRPDGGPLPGVAFSTRVPQRDRVPAVVRPRAFPVDDLVSWVKQRLAQRPEDPDRLRDAALIHLRVGPEDSAARAAEDALEHWTRVAPSVEAYLLLSRARTEKNRAREAVEQALSLDPADTWALHRLAGLRHVEGRTLEATRLWQRTLQGAPEFFPALVRLAEVYRASGLEQTANGFLDRLLEQHPRVSWLVRLRADWAQAQGDVARAQGLYQRRLQENHDDLATRQALADLALRRGDAEAALAQRDAAVRSHPHLVLVSLDRALQLAGMGRAEEAVAELRRASTVDPRSVRALEEMGRLELRAGRRREAWATWQQALAIRPQNAELRGYLAFLDSGRTRGRAERYREDPRALVALGRQRRASGETATVLFDLTAVEVHPSGLSRRLHQRLARVDGPAGVRDLTTYVIRFAPDRQTVDVRSAKVHRAAGGEDSASEEERAESEPWARLWYDTRAKILRFTGLKSGDIVEIEYVLEDVASGNMFADYFGDLVFLEETLPVLRFEYVLVTPRNRPFHVREPRLPGVHHHIAFEGPERVDRWTALHVPKVQGEPGMPGWSEVADYLHVSTYQRWEDVARWYWSLIREQLRTTSSIAETARRITAQASTDQEKLRAIHGYVARSTRYVGLEFGIHGYKPYAVDQVLARKFGDCKDKASLLVALLQEVGIEATLVVLRTRDHGDLDPGPASLAPFNHAIAYLPRHDLYLDGTAEFSGTGELPWQDQGVMALHVDRGQGTLRRTPLRPASANHTLRRARWNIGADGRVRVHEEVVVRGQPASQWRARYQGADQRRENYERAWNASVGGARVLRVAMVDLHDLEKPVHATAELEVTGLARRDASGKLSLSVSSEEIALTQSLGRLSSRRHPLLVQYPFSVLQETTLVPPAGWRFELVPPTASVVSQFGKLTRRTRADAGAVVVTLELELQASRVAPADYGRFRSFLLEVERRVSESVVLSADLKTNSVSPESTNGKVTR